MRSAALRSMCATRHQLVNAPPQTFVGGSGQGTASLPRLPVMCPSHSWLVSTPSCSRVRLLLLIAPRILRGV